MPKKSDLKIWGAGDPNYVKNMAKKKKKTPAKDIKLAPKKITKSEKMLRDTISGGKVKDLNATRKKISKKTGSWPNGMTN
jgi:hypothetical protein